MNSRPLVTVGNDGDGTEVLTPGHYLIGQPLMDYLTQLSHINHSLFYVVGTCVKLLLDTSGRDGPLNT